MQSDTNCTSTPLGVSHACHAPLPPCPKYRKALPPPDPSSPQSPWHHPRGAAIARQPRPGLPNPDAFWGHHSRTPGAPEVPACMAPHKLAVPVWIRLRSPYGPLLTLPAAQGWHAGRIIAHLVLGWRSHIRWLGPEVARVTPGLRERRRARAHTCPTPLSATCISICALAALDSLRSQP